MAEALVLGHLLQIHSVGVHTIEREVLVRPTAFRVVNQVRLSFSSIPLTFIHITVEEETGSTLSTYYDQLRVHRQVGITIHSGITIRLTNGLIKDERTPGTAVARISIQSRPLSVLGSISTPQPCFVSPERNLSQRNEIGCRRIHCTQCTEHQSKKHSVSFSHVVFCF